MQPHLENWYAIRVCTNIGRNGCLGHVLRSRVPRRVDTLGALTDNRST